MPAHLTRGGSARGIQGKEIAGVDGGIGRIGNDTYEVFVDEFVQVCPQHIRGHTARTLDHLRDGRMAVDECKHLQLGWGGHRSGFVKLAVPIFLSVPGWPCRQAWVTIALLASPYAINHTLECVA